jgi:hypothetical protein
MGCQPLAFLLFCFCVVSTSADNARNYSELQVVDDATGRGVPLVELRTVNNIRFVTDSAGRVAINSPELLDSEIYFHIFSHGYEYPSDKFGYRGCKIKLVSGKSNVIRLKRINIAERLYRVTGAGIYRDSVLLEKPVPIQQPLINAQVFGSDSVVNAVYRGKIHWFWGDTNRPNYPLGNFQVPGATSLLPQDGGLNPREGVNLKYYVAKTGFAKPTAAMPGEGPTWINGLVVLEPPKSKQEMFASYVKVKPPMKIYEKGLVRFNDDRKEFEHVTTFDMQSPLLPGGHPLIHPDGEQSYVYFATPYPTVRVRANANALKDPAQYQTYTYLKPGSRKDDVQVERDSRGQLVYGWKRDTIPLTQQMETKLVAANKIQDTDGLFQTKDVETGKPIQLHNGSVYWNPYRQRWIMIAVERLGHSMLGEVWFLESDSLTGPWPRARKILTHQQYSFYNPKQHPMLDREEGRYIYFEGTYTNMFSGNPTPTPRYDYNQIMYQLDLADPRLKRD